MVERVDQLLRTELNQPLGLASPSVRMLDPCCGTGAYLVEVLHRIHRTLLRAGRRRRRRSSAQTPPHAPPPPASSASRSCPRPSSSPTSRSLSCLKTRARSLTATQRAGVYLTNALTGWVPERHPQSAHLCGVHRRARSRRSHQAADTILVILGNPPYNGYAGIATDRRRARPHHRLPRTSPGPARTARPGPQRALRPLLPHRRAPHRRRCPRPRQQGGCGIVCFISNNAWLDGLSHVSMRGSYIKTFQSIYIDNLNGDKYRTGKTTPEGLPDPSAFSTPQNREGIQVGTAIATLVRTSTAPAQAEIHLRDLWGAGKLAQLRSESHSDPNMLMRLLSPAPALGALSPPRLHRSYTTWPRICRDLFPFISRSEHEHDALVVDIDRRWARKTMRAYFPKDVRCDSTDDRAPVPQLCKNRKNLHPRGQGQSAEERFRSLAHRSLPLSAIRSAMDLLGANRGADR